jgi:hypothetical protein
MRSISVSTDVFAKIWALRADGENDEDAILRRVLGCPSPRASALPLVAPTSPNSSGYRDERFDVTFPEGWEIRRTYKGREYVARATSGALHLLNDGGRYRSLNELSRAVGAKTENAWQNWFYMDEKGKQMPVSNLRNPQTIRQRSMPPVTELRNTFASNPAGSVAARLEDDDSDGTWRGDVELALRRLGGRAHLSKIYDEVERIRRELGRSVPRTLDAVIRRTLEDNSSDSDNYKGGPDLFYMPDGRGPGVWALRER